MQDAFNPHTKSRSRGNAINNDIEDQSTTQQCQFDILVDSQKGLFRFWVTQGEIFVCDGQRWKFDVTGRCFSKRDAETSVCFRDGENTATQLGINIHSLPL
jgi:hypothetical protein